MKRVVITGLGVVAPNAIGIEAFSQAIQNGVSGIQFLPELESLKFSCQIAGIPPLTDDQKAKYFSELTLRTLKSTGVIYGCIAGMDAWKDAGLPIPDRESAEPDWDSGTIFGAGLSGIDVLRTGIYQVDAGKVRRLGSTLVEQTMASGVSAHLGGMLGLGNQVSTNSAACSTGTEAVVMAYERIASGRAVRILAGSCDSHGPYVWGGFDSMRVLTRKFNHDPVAGSRPMSASASGFVPGSGAGALVLEEREAALARGAHIYAEVRGGAVNSGGHRQGGTMTAPNSAGTQRCIRAALAEAHTSPEEIDAISGHLTATKGDVLEIANWAEALERKGAAFPWVNSLKSLVGHCLGASGAIECVAAVLQLHEGFLHPSINCEDVHPEIAACIAPDRIPQKVMRPAKLEVIAKSSFGFGDVNAVVVFSSHKP